MAGIRGVSRVPKQDLQRIRRNWNRLAIQGSDQVGSGLTFDSTGRIVLELPRFYAFDNTGSQSIEGTFVAIVFDTTLINENTALFTFAAGVLTITIAGTLDIDYQVSLANSGVDNHGWEIIVERDTGSGFVEISGSKRFREEGP